MGDTEGDGTESKALTWISTLSNRVKSSGLKNAALNCGRCGG